MIIVKMFHNALHGELELFYYIWNIIQQYRSKDYFGQ